MKKIVSCILIVVMMSISLSAAASTNTSADTTNVQYITAGDCDAEQLKAFVESGGIVIDTGTGNSQSVSEELGITCSISENLGMDNVSNDPGKDIATLYYKYGDNIDGVYIINVGTNDVVNQDALINEAIGVIRARQSSNNVKAEETITVDTTETAASTYTAKILGTFDVTTTREPKGKLNASYKVYTVQNYSEKDYYIIKATVTGYPGRVLGDNYESKYKGKGMSVNIGTSTTSVTVDAYGPSRDIATGTTSYGVSLGTSFTNEEFVTQFGLNYTASFNTSDTTVSTTGTPTSRKWNVTLEDDAQTTFFDFSPGVTFDCPYNKSSVNISVYASYDLDSWNTFKETISSDRIITCTPSTASISNP